MDGWARSPDHRSRSCCRWWPARCCCCSTSGASTLKALINVVSTLTAARIAIVAAASPTRRRRRGATGVYLLGNWPAPFGIVLVLDRLSALMLVLTAILALASLVFSLARWHRPARISTPCSSSC